MFSLPARNFSRQALSSVRRFAQHAARPACYADRATKTIAGEPSAKPTDAWWNEVADEKSVADAHKYLNNIEKYVGTVKVPVGLIGPLTVRLDEKQGTFEPRQFYVPFATTEGALLASYNRGAKVITMSGGATATVLSRQMVRAPVFLFDRVEDAVRFYRWFNESGVLAELHKVINDQPHCHAVDLHMIQTERTCHLHIGIDSEDAAGQNMVTYCGRAALDLLNQRYPSQQGRPLRSYIEGGFNSGKRGSNLHFRGKGLYTVVDAVIPHKILKETLHTTPLELANFQRMHARTSTFLGTLSYTAHVANGLCAFYIANGQDPACTAESQAAVTHFDVKENPNDPANPDLYVSMTLPSLIVSTLGGGTGLPSQRANLDLIGVKHPRELACVLAGALLGGEISFYAAICAQEFDKAHWDTTHKK